MAKKFSSSDAKKLITRSARITRSLSQAGRLTAILKSRIRHAADLFLDCEVYKVLQSVPVDEISRTIKMIRIKTLIDSGYATMADVARASLDELIDIQGISSEGAQSIKEVVRDFSDKIRSETKLRLSYDKRTLETTRIVQSVYIYSHSLTYIKLCRSLARRSGEVDLLIDKLQPSAGIFKWMFASKQVKDEASQAYEQLLALMESEAYGKIADSALTALDEIERISADAAWKDFLNNSISYFTVLEETVPGLLGSDRAVGGLQL